MSSKYDLKATENFLVCTACATQYPTTDRNEVKTCFICDDPRQFTPRTGQAFTTLAEIRSKHRNEFQQYAGDNRLISIRTQPQVGIGQRAIVIRTPAGNVLWDCVCLLDDETVQYINSLGGLAAVVISHPHYYTTHTEWGRAFNCPVYLAAEDKKWTTHSSEQQVFLDEVETPIPGTDGTQTGAIAIRLGGHFPGSLVLLFDGRLMIADTLVTTPAGLGNWEVNAAGETRTRPEGMNSFAFLWSIPNMIPLSADEMARMWRILKRYEFKSTHGAFLGMDVEDEEVKKRVLQSMQIQTKYMTDGANHAIMKELL